MLQEVETMVSITTEITNVPTTMETREEKVDLESSPSSKTLITIPQIDTKKIDNNTKTLMEESNDEPKDSKILVDPAKSEDVKPVIENKSSMEILSELFSTFDAEPPVIVKKEKSEKSKKQKKSKKKRKHKDKKHKKKSKKRKRSDSESSSSSDSAVDLSDILVKSENTELSDFYTNDTLHKIIDINMKIKNEEKDIKPVIKKEDIKIKSEKKSHKKKKDKDDSSKRKRKLEEDLKKSKSEEKIEVDVKRRKELKSFDLRTKISTKHRDDFKDSTREDYRSKEDYRPRDDYRSYDSERKHGRHREDSSLRSRSSDRHSYRCERRHSKDRYHDRRKDFDSDSRIDKKKLLEIARKNAIQMMKSGSLPGALSLGPQAQEKVIAAIKSGGKSIEELTDFCKTLSKKEELGELSSISEDSDSENDHLFHHPFQIKDKPLTINIKNSIPLPTKTNLERTSELRLQFPVSSGQQHRKTENDWVPVSTKKVESVSIKVTPTINVPKVTPALPATTTVSAPLAIMPAPAIPQPTPITVVPGPQVFPTPVEKPLQNIDVASIVTQRLHAMRKLRENPNDVLAITQIHKAEEKMNSWAESKQQIGQFTGSTCASILKPSELSAGYQAWAKKDQLKTAAPVTGGMGMHLLQKMGWKPGEGLGKEKTGALEPLLLDVKLDKKGIVAKEEQKKKAQKQQKPTVKTLQGKHPVSLLGEYATKRKLGTPQYIVDFECGPDHKKNFLFKVILNGVEYKPNVASGNKKEAKAMAAQVCLQNLGLLPTV